MKVLLGCLALIVVVLALANFVVFNTTGDAAMPIYVSHPLGMLTVVYLVFVFVVPTMLGRPSARVLPAAGPPTAMFRSGGRLGRVNFSGRLIKVTVHRDRLVLRPFLLGEYTIHGSEIRSVIDLGGMMFRRVQIEHAGPGLFSRVVLRSVPDHARTQIGHIARNPATRPAHADPHRHQPYDGPPVHVHPVRRRLPPVPGLRRVRGGAVRALPGALPPGVGGGHAGGDGRGGARVRQVPPPGVIRARPTGRGRPAARPAAPRTPRSRCAAT